MNTPIIDPVQDATRGKLVLPMIPRVVRNALNLLRDPATGSHELSALLSQDPVLCARVLRLANSPFYGGRRTVASIDDAVSAIGMQALGTLLIAAGVKAAFSEVPGVNLRDFWMFSAVAAAASRMVGQRAGVDRESAYLAGLLYESGHLILCMSYPHVAESQFAHQASRHGRALADAEQVAFGVTHPQVSADWCSSLQLPEAVGDAVARCMAPPAGEQGRLPTVLSLGLTLATAIADGDTAEAALSRLDAGLAAVAGIDLGAFAGEFVPQYASLRQAGNGF